MLITVVFLLLGVASGAISGLFGLGGGIVVVPMLVYLFGAGFTIQALIVSSIVVVFASFGALASYERSYLESRLRKMAPLLLPAFLAAFLGGAAHHMIAKTAVSLGLTALLHALLLLAICVFTEGRDPESTGSYRNGSSSIAGAIIGFVSGLAAVGGGTYTITYAVKVAQQTWRDARMAAQAMGLIIGLGGTAGFLASYDVRQLFQNDRFTLLNTLCIVVACAASSSLFRRWGKSLSGTSIRRGIIAALLAGWVSVLAKVVL